jgi:NAD(P)-dependent dehydrogenase (short-subunit alcohol dehydrogenase family)
VEACVRELYGKVAVVTGGASGIGRGMVLAFADAGMHVVIADVEVGAAEKVADEARALGVKAFAVATDVARLESVEALAERVYGELGAAHVLCNNAGVAVFGPLDDMRADDWRWLLGVNLEGVANGLQAFLPRMKAQAGEKHVVNTASIAGIGALPGIGIYTATKYAVVGISETLRLEGAPWGLGVSVLCPGMVRTRIFESQRNRPTELGESKPATLTVDPDVGLMASMLDPLVVGRRVRAAVQNDELYVFTHPDTRAIFERRAAAIRAGFDAADRWRDG